MVHLRPKAGRPVHIVELVQRRREDVEIQVVAQRGRAVASQRCGVAVGGPALVACHSIAHVQVERDPLVEPFHQREGRAGDGLVSITGVEIDRVIYREAVVLAVELTDTLPEA